MIDKIFEMRLKEVAEEVEKDKSKKTKKRKRKKNKKGVNQEQAENKSEITATKDDDIDKMKVGEVIMKEGKEIG